MVDCGSPRMAAGCKQVISQIRARRPPGGAGSRLRLLPNLLRGIELTTLCSYMKCPRLIPCRSDSMGVTYLPPQLPLLKNSNSSSYRVTQSIVKREGGSEACRQSELSCSYQWVQKGSLHVDSAWQQSHENRNMVVVKKSISVLGGRVELSTLHWSCSR